MYEADRKLGAFIGEAFEHEASKASMMLSERPTAEASLGLEENRRSKTLKKAKHPGRGGPRNPEKGSAIDVWYYLGHNGKYKGRFEVTRSPGFLKYTVVDFLDNDSAGQPTLGEIEWWIEQTIEENPKTYNGPWDYFGESLDQPESLGLEEGQKWRPRPATPAFRVKATLAGPDKGVDPEWHRQHSGGAGSYDVRKLSDEDVKSALMFAKASVPSSMKKARAKLVDLLKKGASAPKEPYASLKMGKPKKWSKMSTKEKQDAIDDAVISFGEAGRRVSRRQAAAILRREYS